MRRKPTDPRKPEALRFQVSKSIYFNDEELRVIAQEASEMGVSSSAWVRMKVLGRAESKRRVTLFENFWDNSLSVRFTPTQWEKIEARALRDGLSATTWARNAILEILAGVLV